MILIDYSHRAINSILSFQSELKGSDSEIEKLIRHVILSTIQSDKKKYHSIYGNVVLACDSKAYWRRDYFPHYKGSRKKAREQSGLPWKLIFDILEKVKSELIEFFPYKVIEVAGAEGDDVIAVLVKWCQSNELSKTSTMLGVFEEPQPIMIISADHDFKQLQKYGKVKQWSPLTKALVKAEARYMTRGHLEHIAKAGDDGIPSVLNHDAVLVTEGERQKPMRAARLAGFVNLGMDACQNETERRNWIRNQTLVDFNFIPKHIIDAIIDAYTSAAPVSNKKGIMNYLIKNRCAVLLDSIDDF